MNLVPSQYRNVSVADVPAALDEESLRAFLVGRPVYRRTRYIVARNGGACAVAEVAKESEQPLFSPVTALTLVSGPEETAFVDAPDADTAVPTHLARVAARQAPQARCVVVRGQYGHVNFIADPRPVRIRVVEVVPPWPPKLVDQLNRVLDLADDLPPIELVPELVDLADLASARPAGHYLFPCRAGADTSAETGPNAETAPAATAPSSGDGAPPAVSYLDEIPRRAPWTLVGCARSRSIHDWFYGGDVPTVDMCPRGLARRGQARGDGPALTKCCLLEDRTAVEDGMVVVPWGATMSQIREGLALAAESAALAAGRNADAAGRNADETPAAPGRQPAAGPALR